ncbi:MAG TPA: aminoacyl-tRNA hydrolase [Clostridiales bacterium]|nr:aminoacyl-tRNA hydrolase [Clostridiales bacterium]HCU56549.1 aminoacyl-tRNA hydrolase [Clostridiales bacterium]
MLIVGLGNVGSQYEGTFHNVGFSVVNKLAEDLALSFRENAAIRALEAEGNISGKKIRILKPTTFMNLSGECVKSALAKYKVDPAEVLIVYDDIDLPLGATRLREKGSAGTHNGMRSVTSLCGELPRLRVGIGRPHPQEDLASYVLKKAGKEAAELLQKAAEKVAKGIEKYLSDGDFSAFSREMNAN